jgi:hypothetical protein
MAGRDHDSSVNSVSLTTEYGKVHLLRTTKPDINNVNTCSGQHRAQGLSNFRTGQAHIPAHNQLAGTNAATESQPDASTNITV